MCSTSQRMLDPHHSFFFSRSDSDFWSFLTSIQWRRRGNYISYFFRPRPAAFCRVQFSMHEAEPLCCIFFFNWAWSTRSLLQSDWRIISRHKLYSFLRNVTHHSNLIACWNKQLLRDRAGLNFQNILTLSFKQTRRLNELCAEERQYWNILRWFIFGCFNMSNVFLSWSWQFVCQTLTKGG